MMICRWGDAGSALVGTAVDAFDLIVSAVLEAVDVVRAAIVYFIIKAAFVFSTRDCKRPWSHSG